MGDNPRKAGKKQGGNPPEEYRFKPGQSGNPGGRPKGTSITARLRRAVLQDNDGAVADALVRAIIEAAKKGDHKFVTTILDRLDGPVKQQIEATVGSTIKYVHADDDQLLDGEGDADD